jgi:hypothetical protein
MLNLMRPYNRFSLIAVLICLSTAFAFGQSAGGLRGTVRNVKGGGIASASVTARKKGVNVKSVTADNKGNFVLDGLDEGLYNLVFEARGYSSGTLYNIEVKKNKIRDLDERLILTPDQGTQVIIKGSVFDREGRSLTAAEIKLEKLNSDGSARKVGTAMSTVSGEFTFRQPEGTSKFRITATFKGKSASKEIEVDTAAIYRLAISLDVSRNGDN